VCVFYVVSLGFSCVSVLLPVSLSSMMGMGHQDPDELDSPTSTRHTFFADYSDDEPMEFDSPFQAHVSLHNGRTFVSHWGILYDDRLELCRETTVPLVSLPITAFTTVDADAKPPTRSDRHRTMEMLRYVFVVKTADEEVMLCTRVPKDKLIWLRALEVVIERRAFTVPPLSYLAATSLLRNEEHIFHSAKIEQPEGEESTRLQYTLHMVQEHNQFRKMTARDVEQTNSRYSSTSSSMGLTGLEDWDRDHFTGLYN